MGLQIDLLRKSFAIVAEREPELTERFYETLFTHYPQTRSLFRQRSRDAQARMLRDALVAVLDHLEDTHWLTETLAVLGVKHATYGVTSEMYDWAGACLLHTLADVAGPDWTADVEAAWVEAYQAVAWIMKEGALSAVIPEHDLLAEPTSPQ